MISRVTLPGRLSWMSVGPLRNTVPIDSPCSPWTMIRSRRRNHRLREFKKNSRREPRRETWTISDMTGPLWRAVASLASRRPGTSGWVSTRAAESVHARAPGCDAVRAGYSKGPRSGLVANDSSRIGNMGRGVSPGVKTARGSRVSDVPTGRGVRGPGALPEPVAGHAGERREERQVRGDVAVDRAERLLEHEQPAADLGGVEPRREFLEHRHLVAVDERLRRRAVAEPQRIAQPELVELEREPELLAAGLAESRRALHEPPELLGLALERREQQRECGVTLRLHVGVGVAHRERASERAAGERCEHARRLLLDAGLLLENLAHEGFGERAEAHALEARADRGRNARESRRREHPQRRSTGLLDGFQERRELVLAHAI